MITFRDLLTTIQLANRSTLAVGFAPVLDRLPAEMQHYDDPFLPFGKAVIDATADLVCAYIFHLGPYLALGAAGARALERTLAYVPLPIIRILHGPFANDQYVKAAFEDAFNANAVTLAASASPTTISAYLVEPQHGAFFKARPDFNFTAFQPLLDQHPNQLGLYRSTPEGGTFEMPAEPRLDIYWHGSPVLYASQRSGFRDAIRTAVEVRRQPPRGAGIW